MIIGYSAGLAVVFGAFAFTGGKLNGYAHDGEVDEVARKEHMRKNRRKPVEEIAMEIGEGRGMLVQQSG